MTKRPCDRGRGDAGLELLHELSVLGVCCEFLQSCSFHFLRSFLGFPQKFSLTFLGCLLEFFLASLGLILQVLCMPSSFLFNFQDMGIVRVFLFLVHQNLVWCPLLPLKVAHTLRQVPLRLVPLRLVPLR